MKIRALIVFGASAVVLTGCQNVKPWQRGALADKTMRLDLSPLHTAQMEHTWFSREEANGGRSVGGGGCGCN